MFPRALSSLLAISLLSSASAIAEPAPSPQANLHYQILQDTAAGVIVTYIKDKLGNVYQLMPAGPKLPWGVSKATIQAQAQRYGWQVLKAGKATGKIVAAGANASIKARVAQVMRAERAGKTLGAVYEVAKLGNAIYVAYTGEGSVKRAQYEIIGGTVSAEMGIGVGLISTKMALGAVAGFGVAALATWSANYVQAAIVEGLDAWDAKEEAMRAEKNWKENDLRLAKEKLLQIRKAITAGDYERAKKLNHGLHFFTRSRMSSGGAAVTMLNTLTLKLQKQIFHAKRAKARALAIAKQQSDAEWQKKLDDFARKVRARQEAEAKRRAEFDARLLILTPNLKPGKKAIAGLLLTRGEAPFELSGDLTGKLASRVTRFTFTAPKEPGAYSIEVTIKDRQGRVRAAVGNFWIAGEKKAPKRKGLQAVPYPKHIALRGCDLRFDLQGVTITKARLLSKKTDTMHHYLLEGVFSSERLRFKGRAKLPGGGKQYRGGAISIITNRYVNNPGTMHSVVRGDSNLEKGPLVRSWDEKIDLRGHKEYQAYMHGLAGNHCGFSVDARFRRGKVTWGLKGTLESMK